MENIINGTQKNTQIIEAIDKRIKKLFESGNNYNDIQNAEEVVEKIDDDNYIKKEDKEEYDILMTLLSYLDFEKEPAENTYEFRGLEYKSEKNSHKTTIYLSKENALKVSKLANDYENKLKRSNSNPNDKKMSIIFPVELLLLKYKGTNMPGLDYEAPEPKTAAQSDEQYEEELEKYYGEHGINKTYDEVSELRSAYPHEKVNYRQDPPVMSNVVQTGYYDEVVRTRAQEELGAEHGEPGLEPDEEQPITATDKGLGRKIGDGLLNLKNLLKSGTLHKKVGKGIGKGLILAGLGFTAVSCLLANPGATLLIAAGATAAIGGAKLVFPPIKRAYKAIKKKLKDWLFGKQLTEEPSTEETMTADEITERIAKINVEIQNITAEIERIQEELKKTDLDEATKEAKRAELAQKNAELKVKRNEITSILHQHDEEHTKGGRSK